MEKGMLLGGKLPTGVFDGRRGRVRPLRGDVAAKYTDC